MIIPSVVKNKLATDTAFCNAHLTTFTGSITPAYLKFYNLQVKALKPKRLLVSLTICLIISLIST
jgi:hypothetical protein